MALLEINDLKTYFPIRSGLLSRHLGDVKAVDGVTLNVEDGETLGLVGESGCGKTTLGRSILRLIEPTEGQIKFEDREILSLGNAEMRDMRRRMQIIFQDPYASLNPRMRVGEIVGEGLKIHGLASGQKQRDIVMRILNRVGLREDHYDRYPHEFSGGQRQRIGVARALIFRPRLIICDEPVSALDVSIQAQILNLLEELQSEFNLTYIFISHDLRVVEHVSHRHERDNLRRREAPVHAGAFVRRADALSRCEAKEGARHPSGRRAELDQSPVRVQLPSEMRLRGEDLR